MLRIPAGLLWFRLPEHHGQSFSGDGTVGDGRSVITHPSAGMPTLGVVPFSGASSMYGGSDAAAMQAFRAADCQVGGGHLYATVVSYLQTAVAPRLFGSVAGAGPSVFAAAGALTEMAGWMAHDAGRDAVAQQHFQRALDLASAGNDGQLTVHVLASMSHLALHRAEPRAAIRLARQGQGALAEASPNPALSARLLTLEARGLGALPQPDRVLCGKALLRAERMLDRAPAEPQSPWISRFDEGSLASEAARCLRQLGHFDAAAEHARRIIEMRPNSHTRSRAFGQLLLASVLVARGEPEQACEIARQTLDATQSLGSYLVLQQLRDLGQASGAVPGRTARHRIPDCAARDAAGTALDVLLASFGRSEERDVFGDESLTGDLPLYQRDPDAWRAHLAEGNATQPRKRVGADVLIRDGHGRILLVDPKYKPDWDLPGGMSEANEPPAETVRREVKEELGLDIRVGALLCVDWVSPHGPWDDSLMFIFDGGALNEDQAANLALLDGELAAFEFCTVEETAERLRSYVWKRVAAALDSLQTDGVKYLQDGCSGSSK